MASLSTYYIGTGKSLIADGNSYTIYGRDFNPRQSDIPDEGNTDKDNYKASGETSFNLSGFQSGNEVCFCVFVIQGSGFSGSTQISIDMNFQKYSGGWQNAGRNDYWTLQNSYTDWRYRGWFYVGIDYDEIRPGATQYRFLLTFSGGGATEQTTAQFTVSNLSFDTTRHPSGYLWVEGGNLCYTDASWSSTQGYKHIINRDLNYGGTQVGSPGAIWLPDSSNDDHIYYVDANGYTRRTQTSQTRFDEGDAYAGSGSAGYLWVSDAQYAGDGYAHLCYVNQAGYKRRICNGGVN